MKQKLKALTPSGYSLTLIALMAALSCLIFNLGVLFDSYGAGTSVQLRQQTSSVVIWLLVKLDSFRLTTDVVTFFIWAAVGVFVLLIIHSISSVYREIHGDLDVASKRYVHPASFSQQKFAFRLALDFGVLVIGLALLMAAITYYLGYALPHSNSHFHAILNNTSTSNKVIEGLVGYLINLGGLVLCLLAARVAWYRSRLLDF